MKNITVGPTISIKKAMKILDKTAEKCLIVWKNKKLLGTLTDGDLRRSILLGAKFSDNIADAYNKEPTILLEGKFSKNEAKKILTNFKLDLIPIVDKNSKVVDYVNWSILGKKTTLDESFKNVPVVIMAGGKGERMKPFTNILPKPMIPINEKTIVEYIIERFKKINCNEFHITVNYKAKILKAYFEELDIDYNINFVEEESPLGTAGSLFLLKNKIKKPFFVSNCDIIVNCNYQKLYQFHNKGNYDITLVASNKEYIIPYGTCELNNNGSLSIINEKPKYDFLINTGLYVVNPNILNLIPKNKFYHITHLIEKAKISGFKIGVFPINEEAWIDIGQWSEYKKAIDLFD